MLRVRRSVYPRAGGHHGFFSGGALLSRPRRLDKGEQYDFLDAEHRSRLYGAARTGALPRRRRPKLCGKYGRGIMLRPREGNSHSPRDSLIVPTRWNNIAYHGVVPTSWDDATSHLFPYDIIVLPTTSGPPLPRHSVSFL